MDSLQAAPPASVVAATTPPSTQWIVHEVIPGEALAEIADRYAVSTRSIQQWNRLAPRREYTGAQLRIQTRLPFRQRDKLIYIIRPGDTWSKIARRYRVDPSTLQNIWNKNERLEPGRHVLIWVEPGTVPRDATSEPTIEDLLVPVPRGARSLGHPSAGRLLNGVMIPENPALYTLRNTDHAYGSTHAIEVLQRAIAAFRLNTHYDGEIPVWDMSLKRGGRYGPHRSHRSGRDVDIGLPLKKGLPRDAARTNEAIDWQATWQLVRSFIETGEVKYIFLSRGRQAMLYRTARANGASEEHLAEILQFPRFTKYGIVRHSPGHTCHLHVRFSCGRDEADCVE